MLNISELSHQKTKLTTQTRTLTNGVRQFIQDHLAEILYAESQGALPAEPESLPKKRRQNKDNEDERKELAARMIALVEVGSVLDLLTVGIDESSCEATGIVTVG